MNNNRTTLEMIASTVEEAVANGLTELGLPREAVEIEVLDEGSRGLFGLGSRQARIRLTVKTADDLPPVAPAPAVQDPPKTAPFITIPPEPAPVGDRTLSVARDTIRELLEKMGIQAEVTSHYGEPEEGRSHVPVLVNILGNDLSILIGRRAETLNALQFIGGLMVGKELGHAITMIIDVEGYRERRQNQIRQLAHRMADQAIKTGRRQVLEPMPANERRIVHIELRNNPSVRTESTGEDPHRKVVIIPEE